MSSDDNIANIDFVDSSDAAHLLKIQLELLRIKEVSPKGNSKRNKLSLNKCLTYTEIFSKRRKIYT